MSLSFDYWEEKAAKWHFSVVVAQRQGLTEGASLAQAQGRSTSVRLFREKAKLLDAKLAQFWNPEKGYFVEALDVAPGLGMPVNKVTNADTQVILALLDAADDASLPIRLTDSRVLATVSKYETLFRNEYEVNRNPGFRERYPRSTAMGRYIEEISGRSPFLPEAQNHRGNPGS